MMDDFCFDVTELSKRLKKSEDWVKIIVTHIHLDHSITQMLKDHIPRYDEVYTGSNGRHLQFSEKLNICDALGFIQNKTKNCIKTINNIRNNYAHNLNFVVSEETKEKIYNTIRDATKKESIEKLRDETFDMHLMRIVINTEKTRLLNLKIKNAKIDLEKTKESHTKALQEALDLTSLALELHKSTNREVQPDTQA